MKTSLTVLLIAIVVGLLILSSAVFTVSEKQTAIKRLFGEIVESDYKPGLHFKIPLFETVTKFDSRIQTLDSPPENFLTSEKKNVSVDSFVKWRIADSKEFFVRVSGDPRRANARLESIIKNGLRGEFSKRTVNQVVSGDRKQIMKILAETVNAGGKELGIDIVDVRIKRVDLPEDVSESVYARMRAERERVARDFRSRGQEAAERIRADADRQRTVLRAEAYRDAENLRGQGDARAAETYANAYTKDSEFYRFHRSLNAYRQSFQDRGDVMILDPKSDFFKYFQNSTATPGAQ